MDISVDRSLGSLWQRHHFANGSHQTLKCRSARGVCVYLFKRLRFPVVVYHQLYRFASESPCKHTQSITTMWCMGRNASKNHKKKSEQIQRWDNDRSTSYSIHKSPTVGPQSQLTGVWGGTTRRRRWHSKYIRIYFGQFCRSLTLMNSFVWFPYQPYAIVMRSNIRKSDRVFLEIPAWLEMAQIYFFIVDYLGSVKRANASTFDYERLRLENAELWHNWSECGVQYNNLRGPLANICQMEMRVYVCIC